MNRYADKQTSRINCFLDLREMMNTVRTTAVHTFQLRQKNGLLHLMSFMLE